MSDIIEVEPVAAPAVQATQSRALNPAQLLQQAVMNGVNPDILQKLMDAQERWEARNARKSFDEAISTASQEIPNIYKAKKGHGYSYEGLDDIARTVRPILSRHGLSYRWKTEQDATTIKVTCIISHHSGHEEQNALTAPIGAVGTKMQNPIQAMGSAITYLQRYTLKAALGLSASLDDDAAAVAPQSQPVTDEQRDHLLALLNEHDIPIDKFCTAYGIACVAALPATDYQKALDAIQRRVSQAKQQLEQADREHEEQANA